MASVILFCLPAVILMSYLTFPLDLVVFIPPVFVVHSNLPILIAWA